MKTLLLLLLFSVSTFGQSGVSYLTSGGLGRVTRPVNLQVTNLTVTVLTNSGVTGSTPASFDANGKLVSATATGSGAHVLGTSPTITTPTIGSFVNATHSHQNAAGGGALNAAAVTGGVFPIARLATGTPDGTKFLRDDGVLAVPSGGGDVVGPAASTDYDLAVFDLTTGKLLKVVTGLKTDAAGNVHTPGQFFSGEGSGVPGADVNFDTDESHHHRRQAASVISTSINEIGPAAPFNGIPKYAVTAVTNMTQSAAVAGTDYSLPITVREEDGAPSVVTTTIRVSNGTLTDNGGGDVSIVTGGGGGSTPTTTRGDLISRGAAVDERLAIGTPGNVLTSDGVDSVWASPRKYIRLVEEFMGVGPGVSAPLGQFAFTSGAGGGSFTATTGTAARPGILNFSTGSATNNRLSLITGATTPATMLFGGGRTRLDFGARIPTLSTAGEEFTVFIGFGDVSGSGTMVDGAFFIYSSSTTWVTSTGNWMGRTMNNSTPTETSAGTAVVAGTWYRLTIDIAADGSSVTFLVDDSIIGSALTTNIPTGAGREFGIVIKLEKQSGTSSRTMDLDYSELWIALTSTR